MILSHSDGKESLYLYLLHQCTAVQCLLIFGCQFSLWSDSFQSPMLIKYGSHKKASQIRFSVSFVENKWLVGGPLHWSDPGGGNWGIIKLSGSPSPVPLVREQSQ